MAKMNWERVRGQKLVHDRGAEVIEISDRTLTSAGNPMPQPDSMPTKHAALSGKKPAGSVKPRPNIRLVPRQRLRLEADPVHGADKNEANPKPQKATETGKKASTGDVGETIVVAGVQEAPCTETPRHVRALVRLAAEFARTPRKATREAARANRRERLRAHKLRGNGAADWDEDDSPGR